jgi:hypothetical protein
MFHPPPAVADVCGLLRRRGLRHCCRSFGIVIRHVPLASTFLRPMAPRALPRFPATMDALTPVGRFFGLAALNTGLSADGSPCFSRPHFQPFCPQPPNRLPPVISVRSRFSSVREGRPLDPVSFRSQRDFVPRGFESGLRAALAGSPVGMASDDARAFTQRAVASGTKRLAAGGIVN